MLASTDAHGAAVDTEQTVAAFLSSLASAEARTWPFRHWLLAELWPRTLARSLQSLMIKPSPMSYRTGRRDENNASRVFLDATHRQAFAEFRLLAASLQDQRSVGALETLCGVDLGGAYLRIEYTQDTDGFWLEPHTDIGAKRLTMQIYLSSGAESRNWGTDLYAGRGGAPTRVPFQANHALLFVPADDSWHGFEKRSIKGVRRSLIVNYVDSEWRSRHELCFPDHPVQ